MSGQKQTDQTKWNKLKGNREEKNANENNFIETCAAKATLVHHNKCQLGKMAKQWH